jgi:hypothetical protein
MKSKNVAQKKYERRLGGCFFSILPWENFVRISAWVPQING